MCLFSPLQVLECFDRTAEGDLVRGGLEHQIEGNKSAEALSMLWLDHQVGQGASDGVHDGTDHAAACSVGTDHLDANIELSCPGVFHRFLNPPLPILALSTLP